MLLDLERSGLFLVPLDERRQWYRFHQLFRDVLCREAAGAIDGTETRRAAAAWFEAHGDGGTAIRYLIAAGCEREAADRLIAYDDDFLDAGAAARREGALAEALTDRELSVLRALQGPLTQREIGGELYLSRNTVKGYTKSLYRKLQVASRADAVRRGRDLGLI